MNTNFSAHGKLGGTGVPSVKSGVALDFVQGFVTGGCPVMQHRYAQANGF
jgi:hypothetical protein